MCLWYRRVTRGRHTGTYHKASESYIRTGLAAWWPRIKVCSRCRKHDERAS